MRVATRLALAVLAVALVIARSEAQVVGIYADSLASSCNLTIPFPGPPVDAYVVFVSGPMADSTGGASFRIEGLPSGWSGEAFANPDGDCSLWCSPFEWPGGQITFPACKSGPVVLYRLRLTPSSAVMDHELRVIAGANPEELSCPQLFGCGGQGGTSLPEARALINGSSPCNALLGRGCPWTGADDLLPGGTSLSITPNPPTARAMITYRLSPSAQNARLLVYDLRGRVVARLAKAEPMRSYGSVVWDGRDAAGVPVGSGLYIVRLETEAGSVSRKIAWIR